jgi:hypothetical protein
VRHKGDTIARVIETSPPNVAFKRDLPGQKLYHRIPYFSVWPISNYKQDMKNSVGTCMKMAGF